MSYYVKGGSNFDTGAQAKMWMILHRAGFPSGDYSDTDWKHIDDSGAIGDPFLWLGGEGGAMTGEFGLYSGSRIRCISGDVQGWNVSSGVWQSLFGTGAAGGSYDKVYEVTTDAEFDTAISDIQTANENALILITADLTNVQATLNDSNCIFTIEGLGHTLDANGDNDILTISACGIGTTIKNCVFNCNDFTSGSTEVISVNESSNNKINVINCYIHGDGTNGDAIKIYSDNVYIDSCKIENTRNGISLDDTERPTNIHITNCYIDVNKRGITAAGSYIYISNNYIRASERPMFFNYGYYVKITNNVFVPCDEAQSGVLFYNSYRCSLIGNAFIVESARSTGHFKVIDLNNCTQAIAIGNNVINNDSFNDAYDKIGLNIGNAEVVAIGNNIEDISNAGAGTGYGIYISADGDNSVVIGNITSGCDTDVSDGSGGTCTIEHNEAI